mmetsp:Transcript_34031/g.78453  ORF Transcript_34031/g.78453 Transcript_34031/m.78453 type:complete len:207 (-) Transcript_34031:851-1471(-)
MLESISMELAILKKFMEYRRRLRVDGWPSWVTLGYHYTNANHMDSIRQHRLLSQQERMANIQTTLTGSSFDDGIYTGNNPIAFCRYGSLGICVVMLEGNQKRVLQGSGLDDGQNIHSVVRNKSHKQYPSSLPHLDEVVLRISDQCLPLFVSDKVTAYIKQENYKHCISVTRRFENSLMDSSTRGNLWVWVAAFDKLIISNSITRSY